MKTLLIILNQLIIRRFYELNAGFFLFLFIMFFGIVPPSQMVYYHLTIMESILAIPAFFVLVASFWFWYNFKCLQFVWKKLQEPENEFIYVLNQFSTFTQFTVLVVVQLGIYLPFLLYGLSVAGLGFMQGKWLISSGLLVFHCLLCGLNVSLFYYKINHPNPEKSYFLVNYLFNWRSQKSLPILFIEFVFNDLKWLWLLIKSFDLLILWGFLALFKGETYDGRIVAMAFLVGLLTNCNLVFQIRRFENTFFNFSRNLPYSLPQRFAYWGGFYTFLLLPEFLFMLQQIPYGLFWLDFAAFFLFGNGLLLYFHSLLYRLGENMDLYLRWVFGLFMGAYFLVLFQMYWLIVLLSLAQAYRIFQKHYYRFEKLETL
jgi:hypothetical protein